MNRHLLLDFSTGEKGWNGWVIISHYGCSIPSQNWEVLAKESMDPSSASNAFDIALRCISLFPAQILLSYKGKASPTIAVSCECVQGC